MLILEQKVLTAEKKVRQGKAMSSKTRDKSNMKHGIFQIFTLSLIYWPTVNSLHFLKEYCNLQDNVCLQVVIIRTDSL